ncbi:MAG TPA: DUF3347 domain-containing protein [Chitinophagaceae bacterium]
MKKLLVYLPLALLLACGGKDKEGENPQPEAAAPLAKSQNSEAFNSSFRKVLDDYYALKDGLVKSNSSVNPAVDSAAGLLAVSADSIRLNELKADSSIISTIQLLAQNIASESRALVGEKNLDDKRRSFQMISDNLYNLIRTTRYDQEVAYYQYCPMAFNDQGAYWLSRQSEIRNPYFANKMLTCGEVKETLDFRTKAKQ